MTSIHSCTCPQATRVTNRRSNNRKVWGTKKWKDNVIAFKQEHPTCFYCGNPTQVAHHPTDCYYGKPGYEDLHISECVWLCNSCHWYIARAFEWCKCGTGWRQVHSDHCPNCKPKPTDEEIQKLVILQEVKEEKAERDKRTRNQQQNDARRPYLDAQNAKQREFYKTHRRKP